jgi:hypothetical protein
MDQESRRRPKGDQVGQRIKLAAKRALNTAHAGNSAIKEIKDASQQNKAQTQLNLIKEICGRHVRLYDFGQGDKAAEQVAGSEEVGKEVDLKFRLKGFSS